MVKANSSSKEGLDPREVLGNVKLNSIFTKKIDIVYEHNDETDSESSTDLLELVNKFADGRLSQNAKDTIIDKINDVGYMV